MKYLLWISGALALVLLVAIIIRSPGLVYNPRPKVQEEVNEKVDDATIEEEPTIPEGVQWQLREMLVEGSPELPVGEITILLEDGRFSGNGGCNSYFGDYELNRDGIIIIDPPASTRMACPGEDISDHEYIYFSLLPKTYKYEVAGEELRFIDSAGNAHLIFTLI